MAHGGRRPGSGRPKGAAAARTREIADKAALEGVTPLEFMLNRMRDEEVPMDSRFAAAVAAAPYIHAKLSSIDAKLEGDMGMTVEIVRFGADKG